MHSYTTNMSSSSKRSFSPNTHTCTNVFRKPIKSHGQAFDFSFKVEFHKACLVHPMFFALWHDN